MGTFICHHSHDYLCKGITMVMKLWMNNNLISRILISEIVKQECRGVSTHLSKNTYVLVYQQ